MVAMSIVSGYGSRPRDGMLCRYCGEYFGSLDNLVKHFVGDHEEAWNGEELKSIKISVEFLYENGFVNQEHPENICEERDFNPRDQYGRIKRCYHCESVKHLSYNCPDIYYEEYECYGENDSEYYGGHGDHGNYGEYRSEFEEY